jgi:uncharacterized protein
MPHRSSVPMSWRMAKNRYGIIGSRCEKGHLHFPPRMLCNICGGKTSPFQFNGQGEILSYTIIHTAPEGFEKMSPYAIALVKLDEGVIISSQVVGDINKVSIGERVQSVFRKLFEDGETGVINYGFKFELVD